MSSHVSDTMRNCENIVGKHAARSPLNRIGLTPEQVRAMTSGRARPRPMPKAPQHNGNNGHPYQPAQDYLQELQLHGCHPDPVPACLCDVDPRLARAWLANNEGNRKPSQAKIKRFAAMMSDGLWEENGESIKFGDDGRLLDGQSRLQAVILADLTVRLEVRFGLPSRSQESMDTGEKRSVAHTLQMAGYKDANNVGTALRLLHQYLHGKFTRNSISKGAKGKTYYFCNRQALQLIESHPRLQQAVKDAWVVSKWISPGRMGFLYYLFMVADPDRYREFRDGVGTGAGLPNGSPMLALRARLMMAAAGEELPLQAKLCLVIKAWNALRAGEEVHALTWREKENYPPVSGCKMNGRAA